MARIFHWFLLCIEPGNSFIARAAHQCRQNSRTLVGRVSSERLRIFHKIRDSAYFRRLIFATTRVTLSTMCTRVGPRASTPLACEMYTGRLLNGAFHVPRGASGSVVWPCHRRRKSGGQVLRNGARRMRCGATCDGTNVAVRSASIACRLLTNNASSTKSKRSTRRQKRRRPRRKLVARRKVRQAT